jgi:protein pelota
LGLFVRWESVELSFVFERGDVHFVTVCLVCVCVCVFVFVFIIASMKLLRRDIARDGSGSVKLVPEEAEDMWHVYNLVATGDRVEAVTVRKVMRQTASGGGEAERVRLKLEVEVETVEYDKVASVLRVRGKNITENEHVRLGAYHTMELDQQRPFALTKTVWDSMAIDYLKQACDPAASADVVAVMMQEGLANICLVGQSITTVKARIETSIPRKRGPAIAGYDKALNKFFENVLQAVLRHVNFTVVRCLVIASPGFTKDQFYDYMMLEATRRELRGLIENKSKIILAHSSSGYKHSLKEVLSAPTVMVQIKDTKAAKEVKAMEDFFTMLSNDPSRAFYGPGHVEAAHERLAVQTLLITDELFRSADIVTRRKYVDLVESVKAGGGEVYIFSSMHVSGEQLGQLTGIAAILRFPLPDLEDMEL